MPFLKIEVIIHLAKGKDAVERARSAIANARQKPPIILWKNYTMQLFKCNGVGFGKRSAHLKTVVVGSKDVGLCSPQSH